MSDNLDLLSADLQNYVVAPLNAFGLGGFVFDVEGESLAHLSADITDHYTEDNRAVQDHIAIRPKQITLKGYIGEVVYNAGTEDGSFIETAVQKLTVLSSFLPVLSAAATQAVAAIQSPLSSDISLSNAANIYGLVKNLIGSSGPEAKQQKAYNYFRALMNQGIIMSVQTPWEFMTSMAITSVVALQTERSIYESDFAITLKEIRIAKTLSGAYSTSLPGQSGVDNLSPQANQSALSQYRQDNGLGTPPIDIELQGVAAVQAPLPVPIGDVPGVALPTSTLPGWQSQLNSVQDIISNPGASSILNYATTPKP